MANVRRFEDLDAWKEAKELAKAVYAWSENGKISRDFGLKDQIRRCAVSVMANIAEGFERNGDREFIQFLAQAKGSCGELRSHLILASELDLLSTNESKGLIQKAESISRMIWGLMNYIRRSKIGGAKYAPS